ncbi:MAG: VWA domain-containing protein [Verrucomicrobiae bacterium]|nr:VWA domain-containing protein [Verrucomicrobiae bacterium]
MKPYLLWILIAISALLHGILFFFLSGYSFWQFSHKKAGDTFEKIAMVQLTNLEKPQSTTLLAPISTPSQKNDPSTKKISQENLQSLAKTLQPSENISRQIADQKSEKAQDQLFGITSEGFRFVYLLDVSGSMLEKAGASTRLDYAKQEIKRAITQLPEEAEFNILLFADRVSAFSPQCLPATAFMKKKAFDFLDRDTSLGGVTDIVGGLGMALQQWPDVIFLLTDGASNTSEDIFRSQWQYLYHQSHSRTQISVIGFLLDAQQENLLREIASLTQGKFWHWKGG